MQMQRHILIVEDAETTATTLEIALMSIPDVRVVRVGNGQRAIEYLSRSDGQPVHAVITDLEMPLLDGFELIRRLREHRQFELLPIVVVSGHDDPQTPERVIRLGANAFFAKPCSPLEVRQKVEDLLKEK